MLLRNPKPSLYVYKSAYRRLQISNRAYVCKHIKCNLYIFIRIYAISRSAILYYFRRDNHRSLKYIAASQVRMRTIGRRSLSYCVEQFTCIFMALPAVYKHGNHLCGRTFGTYYTNPNACEISDCTANIEILP